MSKEAMKLALEALKYMDGYYMSLPQQGMQAIKALEEALAKQEHEWVRGECVKCGASMEQEQGEPVAWQWLTTAHFRKKLPKDAEKGAWNPLYTTPQQRKPLTLEQLREHWQVARVLDMTDAEIDFADYVLIARDVEALYGIKE